jgi:tetratricopeptide (TPR) repeat protein
MEVAPARPPEASGVRAAGPSDPTRGHSVGQELIAASAQPSGAEDRLPCTQGLAAALIVVASLLTFSATLRNTFLPLGFDDGLILYTPAIQSLTWEHVRSMATEFNRVNYIPVTMLSFALQYAVSGLEPFGYHLVNMLLHATAAVLVFVFLKPIVPSQRVALTAALLFALHPVQMSTVSLAVERKTLLSGVFCLVTLIAYQRWKGTGARRHYAIALVAFLLAALSKAMAVSLPAILLLYDYVFLGRPLRWLEKLPFGAIAVAVSCAAVAGHAHLGVLVAPHGGTPLTHTLIVGRATLEYVTSLFLPLDLAPVYYYPRTMIYAPLNFLAVALIAFVCLYVAVNRRRYAWSFFCLAWFILMLLPESNVVPLAQLRADRYMYLPSVGFALWVAIGLNRLPDRVRLGGRRVPLRGAGFAVAAILAVSCYRSAGIWHDDVSAWSRVVERHPWSSLAQSMLGRAYYDRNDDVSAERALQQALRFATPPPDAYLYLAKLYAAYGLTGPARAHLQRYLELAPNDPEGQELLGTLAAKGNS